MKCTRKTEDKLRKIVFFVLLLVVAIATTFVAILFTQEFLIFVGIVACALTIVVLFVWLMGDISFCKGDN